MLAKLLPLLFLVAGTVSQAGVLPQNEAKAVILNDGWAAGWSDSPDASPVEWEQLSSPIELPANRAGGSFVRYRLALPAFLSNDAGQVLVLPDARYQLGVFLDGKPIYQFGTLDLASRKHFFGLPMHVVPLGGAWTTEASGESRTTPLQLEVVVFSNESRIGLTSVPLISEYEDLFSALITLELPRILISGFLIILGILSAGLLGRSKPFRHLTDFSGLAFFFGAFTLLGCQTKDLIWKFPLAFDHAQAVCAFASLLFWLRFFPQLIGNRGFKLISIAKVLSLLSLILLPILSLTQVLELPRAMLVFQVVLLFSIGAYLHSLITMTRERNRIAVSLLIGSTVVCAAVINDILLDQLLIKSIRLSGFAMMFYIMQFGVLLITIARTTLQTNAETKRDLQIAAGIQSLLLQKQGRLFGDNHLDITYKPASKIGGDWYYYNQIGQKMLHMHVADIVGHGPQAALGASYLKGVVDAYYRPFLTDGGCDADFDLTEFHQFINFHFCHFTNEAIHATMMSMIVDLSSMRYSYLNSAHPPAFIFDPETNTANPCLERKGSFLGFDKSAFLPHTVEWHQLPPRAIICMYTDGLNEIQIGRDRQKGHASIRALFSDTQSSPTASTIHENLKAAIKRHGQNQLLDDITVMTLQTGIAPQPK